MSFPHTYNKKQQNSAQWCENEVLSTSSNGKNTNKSPDGAAASKILSEAIEPTSCTGLSATCRLNVSNPPPLWGLKFLLSTSGPAWWVQTGLEFCPHANSFPPYRTVPAAWLAAMALTPPLWELSGQTRRILDDSYGHCCFSVRPPSPKLLFHHGGITEGDDTLKSPRIQMFPSICSVHIFTASVRFAGKRHSNVGGKGSIWTVEITKSATVAVWMQDKWCPAFPVL